MTMTSKFQGGGVWSRQYHDKEEIFTVDALLPSDEPNHHPLAVTFADGTTQIFSNHHNNNTLKAAKRIGFKCCVCGKIMFGAEKAGECEDCELVSCDGHGCHAVCPRNEMTEGGIRGQQLLFCPQCKLGTKEDHITDKRDE